MDRLKNNGFYLQKNYVYDYVLDDGHAYLGRIIENKKDSIFITSAFSEKNLNKFNIQKYDTFKISVRQLKKLKLSLNRLFDTYHDIDLSNYDFIFIKQNKHCGYVPKKQRIYEDSYTTAEIFPYLTSQSIAWIYDDHGEISYFTHKIRDPRPAPKDTIFHWSPFCILPTFDFPVDQINGLAVGFIITPSNVKDSIEINGLALEGLILVSYL